MSILNSSRKLFGHTEMETELIWETVIDHGDYEIATTYPHQIRKKANGAILAESLNKDGYNKLKMNRRDFMKHRLIALQFIPNPDLLPDIDHINHVRTDNRTSNLRWISSSDNQRNKSSNLGVDYVFVDEISKDAIRVTDYRGHHFDNLFFHDDKFYFFNGHQYRILHIHDRQDGVLCVKINDNNHKDVKILYSTFKRQYDLI
jgi:hypothetical protein